MTAIRSFNRILGRTSLELKCLCLFGLFLLVVSTVSFLLYWQVTNRVVFEQSRKEGRQLVREVMLITHWRELEVDEGFRPTVDALAKNLSDPYYDWRFIQRPDRLSEPVELDGPTEDQLPRDEFERELLKLFMRPAAGEGEEADTRDFEERYVNDGREYQYYQPVRIQRTCVTLCHPEWGPIGQSFAEPLVEGDLAVVVQVSIENPRILATIKRYWALLLGAAIITAFLAMIAFYVVIRYVVVRPVKHLRDVSEAVGRGDIALRAEIRTGDEFESLALAFNRMLRHLIAAQDELRLVNTSLDNKVDQLAQLNMQLYEMNRVKSDFMATMSHELRTPLNSILGFSDVLGSIKSLDDKQKRYVENIRKSGRLLLEMINNVLDLAKIESGKMQVRLTEFSIHQIVNAQCELARPLTEKKNIDLEAVVPPHLPPMTQDQTRVQQIINNLLSNAIKFTPEGGRIKVTVARTEQKELVLEVTDTGVGISEEDQQAIFEKFRQGQTASPKGEAITREYSGTGLGLSIVKELCKLLEGEVSVRSELGTGSTFTVVLPWVLGERPLLDSPLAASFEEFSKPRLDLRHGGHLALPQPLSSGPHGPSVDEL
jgi:signal transduction histidine kinase